MKNRIAVFSILVFASWVGVAAMSNIPQEPQPFPPPKKEPPIVTPGKADSDSPSDGIVLFDGMDLCRWRSVSGGGDQSGIMIDGLVELVAGVGGCSMMVVCGGCEVLIALATSS